MAGAGGVLSTLADAVELPQPVQDIPLWSENFCFTGWDAAREVGVFVHVGRTPVDPQLWHEIIAVHLPDGRTLLGKNFSRSLAREGPNGSLLQLRCERPFRRWSIAFDGPLHSVSAAQLATAPLADGPQPGVHLELSFTSELPVWDFGQGGAGGWAKRHYQQLGSYRGQLAAAGLELELEMIGWRDHSVGARDMSPFVSHSLLTAQFEDGSWLYAVTLQDQLSDDPMILGRWGRGTSGTELSFDGLPVLDDPHSPSPVYEFSIATDEATLTARAEMLCILPVTMFPPNDMVLGLSPGPGAYVLWMGQARVELDGRVGYGHLERAARVPA
jgi:hypothetical protein